MHWMYNNIGYGGFDLIGLGLFSPMIFVPVVIWALAWKGWALWLAARRGELVWFIVLLIINTLGLLEIFYIFAIAKQRDTRDKDDAATRSKEGIGKQPARSQS